MLMLKTWTVLAGAKIKSFLSKENGEVNFVAMIILIAIAILIAVAFRDQIGALVTKLLGNISSGADKATGGSI